MVKSRGISVNTLSKLVGFTQSTVSRDIARGLLFIDTTSDWDYEILPEDAAAYIHAKSPAAGLSYARDYLHHEESTLNEDEYYLMKILDDMENCNRVQYGLSICLEHGTIHELVENRYDLEYIISQLTGTETPRELSQKPRGNTLDLVEHYKRLFKNESGTLMRGFQCVTADPWAGEADPSDLDVKLYNFGELVDVG